MRLPSFARPASSYAVASELLARAIAVAYLLAFVSFGVQADGLIGSRGILSVAEMLRQARGQFLPTLLVWNASDSAIQAICWTGAVLAIVAAVLHAQSLWRRVLFLLLWILYLSLVSAGQVFMGFQWDYLLLEAGFLAIFLAPDRVRIWLFQWLLFRLMLESGLAKLASNDPTWRNLTALTYHYETQPLPTPIAWYAAHAPLWFQKVSTATVFVVELVLPFAIFGPRRFQQVAAFGIAALQLLILITGNYTFFNWLTIALCFSLLDDRFFGRSEGRGVVPQANRFLSAALVAVMTILGGIGIAELRRAPIPGFVASASEYLAPYGIANQYGLFATMTKQRLEIEIQGSNDANDWRTYEFRFKPGPLDRMPPWVAPYQPRLDWQMWFAALGSAEDNPWFTRLLIQLLHGSPAVLRLFARDPFDGKPPKYVRAQMFEYHFTRDREKGWWTREARGSYFPVVSLK